MRKFLLKFTQNIENYKIYHIIILFTTVFIILFLNGIYHIREEHKVIATQNRILITKEIDFTISSWFEARIKNLENSAKYLSMDDVLEDERILVAFIEVLLNQHKYFDAIQVLVPDEYFYVNTRKANDYHENPIFIHKESQLNPMETPWYLNTKKNMQTTITIMDKHATLLKETMNICTPIQKNEQFKGVVCGILKTDSLFDRINQLDFPQNAYYFVNNTEGKILAGINKPDFQKELEEIIRLNMKSDFKFIQKKIVMENDVLTLTKLHNFDWYIGVGMSKEDIMQESAQKVTSHAIFLFLCFLLLLLIINTAHTFLRKRVEQKQKEYEYMLSHRSRISEIGKLISGINHQLKQPLNATALVVSNTLDMSERELLDKQTLEENLKLCQKSITLMDKTIGIFRNFYRCSEEITHFKLFDCIQSVLHVKHVDLSRHNIVVEVNAKEIASIEVESIENYIQQILLVLIQNARDALMLEAKNFPKKEIVQKIHLSVFEEFGRVTIDISDWGCGVSKEMNSTLFSEFKSSKKYEGSGIGLYFAKKLAREKLMGDLVLHNRFAPTIFRLTLAQSLSYKES
ncbi:sensor histidine kinase [Sulfurospirillum halorespirans]|uniref:histidine kinase n=1 Tax=Sulfurospirillum halorespirans DSM 13726 TaxID=1193502 RepID=A0A1D7TFQ7_9BACT|nr:sensor histidine kinase [Sulfurospirillum halorespirans]AOO63831.1 putative histidine kinase [Sulfurospirillum halorespirans DSM 13726]